MSIHSRSSKLLCASCMAQSASLPWIFLLYPLAQPILKILVICLCSTKWSKRLDIFYEAIPILAPSLNHNHVYVWHRMLQNSGFLSVLSSMENALVYSLNIEQSKGVCHE